MLIFVKLLEYFHICYKLNIQSENMSKNWFEKQLFLKPREQNSLEVKIAANDANNNQKT